VDWPDPVIVPGLIVQFPAGRSFNTTLADADVHEGWVMSPNDGTCGAEGAVLILIPTDGREVHPEIVVTVN